jgi:signal transduction histidine kinase
MRFRTWPVAAFALGALLLLVVVSVLESNRRAQEIYVRLDEINQRYHEVENRLRRLRSDVNLSGIFVRDYLLDAEGDQDRSRLQEFRDANGNAFAGLRDLLAGTPENDARLDSLRAKLNDYWMALDPLFDWTQEQKRTLRVRFLRREVLPRREAVLAIAQEIEEINASTMDAQRTAVANRQAELRRDLYTLLAWALFLGIVVALTAVYRLRRLEQRSDEERRVAEEAEHHMRQLSQQLVATQEEERKKLSRELHDHVGQVLTALRMELGSIDRLREPGDLALARAVNESRHLVDSMVRTVRDLALGLRPSMLDDFGLQPALEWHVRDLTRRSGIAVDLSVTGNLSQLPDSYATCIYRVVQEALTNCVRHSSASKVGVTVSRVGEAIRVSVSDNGVGIQPASRRTGLGLRGIEERVRDLDGTVDIQSTAAGTSLMIRIPLPHQDTIQEVDLAHIAG